MFGQCKYGSQYVGENSALNKNLPASKSNKGKY